jgi:CRISPR-associated exonuclease Cas4
MAREPEPTPAVASEDDLLPISALQHYLFCPRQFALIHVERQWAENRYTAEGRLLHKRIEAGGGESRDGVRIARSVQVRSFALGVFGVADVVEMHDAGRRPVPVEYKRGRPKAHRADEVQLCAQAICLEEMLDRPVAQGFLFYGRSKRRKGIVFDAELQALTYATASSARQLLAQGRTPAPRYEARNCTTCSLLEICRPRRLDRAVRVDRWLAARLEE